MGAACTKSTAASEPKSTKRETKERKETKPIEPAGRSKTITIGVFGIEGSGKTTIIKAIDGDPTDDVRPTTSETTTTITEPFVAPANRKKSNQNRTTLCLIDVSGTKSSREKLWEKQYDKIHGWIYVVDPTNRKRIRPSQETLDDLFDNKKIKDKPVLFLLTKQDQSGSIESKEDFCDDFDLDRFKPKSRIELCVGLPQRGADRIDPSLRQGVQWLIRTIEDNYGQLNSRVTKTDDSESERETRWNSSRLPDIRQKPLTSRSFKDDDDDDEPKVTRRANSAQQRTKSFRASYETLPEDTPWSTSKIDEKFPRLTTKSSLTTNSTRKRDISPLVHDTKLSSYGTSTRKNSDSDDDNDRRRKPNPMSRFDYPTNSSIKKSQTNRFDDDDDDEDFRSTSKKNTKRSNYDDDDDDDTYNNSTRGKKVLPKSRFDHDDDDDHENRGTNSKFQSNRFKSSRDFSD